MNGVATISRGLGQDDTSFIGPLPVLDVPVDTNLLLILGGVLGIFWLTGKASSSVSTYRRKRRARSRRKTELKKALAEL